MPVLRDRVLSIGSSFAGGYEILAPLGEGSFGRVYTGRQRSTGQAVAIKTLRLRQGDAARDVENQIAARATTASRVTVRRGPLD